ncbi:sugar phosphate isomerase/epimerase [Candidatus Pelagibacter sp.]|nr:sugar phosphate isomerase/epimerase [Candidatus Pelagibacter sp.]
MISLNTYSFALRMGLLSKKKKIQWNLRDFVDYSKNIGIKRIEFPIDYFAKKENQSFEYFFKLLKRNDIYPIIALEKYSIKSLRNLLRLSNNFKFNIIRVKMSNLFGGNRYKQADFYKKKKNFVKFIKKSVKLIDNSRILLVIENHQDLNSSEIINIIKSSKSKNLGINWDIGNSLPTCETPNEFFENAKNFIFNVHCKDYKVILSKDGYYMKRCVLGDGIIKFNKYYNFFKKKNINVSLELAAQISRHSDIFNKQFFKPHKLNNKKIRNFKKFIKNKAINESPLTNWQSNYKIINVLKDEKREFEMSYKYLKNL